MSDYRFDPLAEKEFTVAFEPTGFDSVGFDSPAAQARFYAAKANAFDAGAKFLTALVRLPGLVLLQLGFLSLLFSGLLVGLAWYRSGSTGWVVAGVVWLVVFVVFLLLWLRRRDLLRRLASEGGWQGSLIPSSGAASAGGTAEFMRREGESVQAARVEFKRRGTRFFPRIEAGQRALRELAGGAYRGAWLEHDLRPTLVLFVMAVLALPLLFFISLVAFIGVLAGF